MSQLILVTGASGYLGTHIVQQLLTDGYRVRAVARGKKAEALKTHYAGNSNFDIVEISDIATDQFPDALKGVDAVIHTASPLPGREQLEKIIPIAIEGSLNILRQAEKAGIKKIIVTSSILAVLNSATGKSTWEDWNQLTQEIALGSKNPANVYIASKKYAELAVWEWAEQHPHVDITTLLPPYLYGPVLSHTPIATLDTRATSTARYVWNFVAPNGKWPPQPVHLDVRDVAKQHVLAITAPPATEVGRKRIIIATPHEFKPDVILETLKKERPQLASRLITATPPTYPFFRFPTDFDRLEKILGFKKEQFTSFESTILDTVDSLLHFEEVWKKEGKTEQEILDAVSA